MAEKTMRYFERPSESPRLRFSEFKTGNFPMKNYTRRALSVFGKSQ